MNKIFDISDIEITKKELTNRIKAEIYNNTINHRIYFENWLTREIFNKAKDLYEKENKECPARIEYRGAKTKRKGGRNN